MSTPGLNEQDIMIHKNFQLGGGETGRRPQLRFEMFNAFNHPSFSGVNNRLVWNIASNFSDYQARQGYSDQWVRNTRSGVTPPASSKLGQALGEVNALHPTGARRVIQLAAKIAWTPDGQGIILSAAFQFGSNWLWRCPISEDSHPDRLNLAGEGAMSPALSGNRLAYSSQRGVTGGDIWILGPTGPRKHPVSSTRLDGDPQFSPDGRRIAFVSNRSGRGGEIWVANQDGTNPARLTEAIDRFLGSPRWSPDGRWIAFDGQSEGGHWDIFVIESAGGQVRRLTQYPSDEHYPSWSRDGKWIYFCSNQTKRFEIWRISSGGGEGIRVTESGGSKVYESWDGKSLYYKKQAPQAVFVRPVSGGAEHQVLMPVNDFFPVEGGLYYVSGSRQEGRFVFHLSFWDAATEKSRLLNRLPGPVQGLCVSPDRKTVLYSGPDREASGVDLMLIENFR